MALTLHTRSCGLEIAVTYIPSVVYVTCSDGSYSGRTPCFKNTSLRLGYDCSRFFPRVTQLFFVSFANFGHGFLDNKTTELLRIHIITMKYYELQKYSGHMSNLRQSVPLNFF